MYHTQSPREGLGNPFLSEGATRNARRALAIGLRRARDEGILITAPPGVSFAVGLRYEDVFDDGGGGGGGGDPDRRGRRGPRG